MSGYQLTPEYEERIRKIRETGWREPSPTVDAIEAAMAPDRFDKDGAPKPYSPAASLHPLIVEARGEAQRTRRTIPDLKAVDTCGITFLRSSMAGNPLRDFRPEGHDLMQGFLSAGEDESARRRALAERVREFEPSRV